MTKRDTQAAEYAKEFKADFLRHQYGRMVESIRLAERIHRHQRRDTLGIRVHRAVLKWLRVVWLRFLGR